LSDYVRASTSPFVTRALNLVESVRVLVSCKSPRIIDSKTALALYLAPGTPEIIEVKFFGFKIAIFTHSMRNIVELNAPEKLLRPTSAASKISAQLIEHMKFYKKHFYVFFT
jgi:hypothetical protein